MLIFRITWSTLNLSLPLKRQTDEPTNHMFLLRENGFHWISWCHEPWGGRVLTESTIGLSWNFGNNCLVMVLKLKSCYITVAYSIVSHSQPEILSSMAPHLNIQVLFLRIELLNEYIIVKFEYFFSFFFIFWIPWFVACEFSNNIEHVELRFALPR